MEDGDWVLVRPPAEKDLWTPSLVKEDESSKPLKVTFGGPAKFWTDAIPIGNGRLGAMVWGGVPSETLQLNEDTLWTGTPGNYTNPNAPQALTEVRKLVDDGKYVEATEAAVKLSGDPSDVYQLLGDINLEFEDSHLKYAEETYSRELDLDTATARIKYSVGDVEYTREHFASNPDQVIVTKISASKSGSLSFTVSLDSKMHHGSHLNGKNQIILEGSCPGRRIAPKYNDNPEGIQFTAVLDLQISGDKGVIHALDDKKFRVEEADWAVLLLVASSSFKDAFTKPSDSKRNPTSESLTALNSIRNLSYSDLYAHHLDDYQNLFHRVSLQLSKSSKSILGNKTLEMKKLNPITNLNFKRSDNALGSTADRTPPLDIMENILQRVNSGDRIRLRNSCKHWKSIVMRRDIPGAPHELPWLLLPQGPKGSSKCLSFASFTERKEVKLKLPKEVRGSWIYGSSKGWLIMVKEKGLQSTMCLLNPISGALHKLPPLRTIPSFKKIVKTWQWKRFGANIFLLYVALLTPHDLNSSGHFTVAIIFEDFKGQKTLGLCKLEDLTWSLFRVFDNNDRLELVGILFSRGILYALVNSQKDGLVAATRILNFADHEVKLKLIHDKHEHKNVRVDDFNSDYARVSNANYRSILLESTSNEVLVIHQMVDYVLCREGAGDFNDIEEDDGNIIVDNQEGVDQDNDGDEGNHENDHEEGNLEANNQDGGEIDDVEYVIDEDMPGFNPHVTTRSFRVYKIDPNNNNLLPVQNLGNQVFFLGDGGGSVSLPAGNFPEVKRNCIYFATNYVWSRELTPKTYRSREIGIFYLDGERIIRPFSSVRISLLYQATWFTPSL